jgi:lysyl-tRNA synthetase class 2
MADTENNQIADCSGGKWTREEFLKKLWMPYPALQSSILNIADFSQILVSSSEHTGKSHLWIGGRFAADRLSSEGRSLVLKFDSQTTWPYACAFDSALLSDGDLLAVRMQRDESLNWSPRDVILLTIPQGPSYQLEFSFARSREWMRFTAAIRSFFIAREFTEALTPTLVVSPGTEPFLDPFLTQWEMGTQRQTFYLPTSPEFHLKKILAAGWTKVFEIKSCFRNGEISEHHQPEFQMLEWYRAYANLQDIKQDVEALFLHLGMTFQHSVPSLERVTMAELFLQKLDFILQPQTTAEEMRDLCRKLDVVFSESDSFDDLFFRIFLEKIEPDLGNLAPLIVSDYPPSQAALARLTPDGWADRFEVYWQGLELANAFHELNDPQENGRRFADDFAKKKSLGKPSVPRDEELMRALAWGLPPSGGIALGLDRLFMAFFAESKIARSRAFPFHSN